MEIRYEKKEPLIPLFKDLEMGDLFIYSGDKGEGEPAVLMKTMPVKNAAGMEDLFNSVLVDDGKLYYVHPQSAVIKVDHELIVTI